MYTTEEQIKKLYSSQLASQQEQLKQGYLQADAEYAAEKDKAAKTATQNINLTKLEAQQAAVNDTELHAASGLTSGARAQARLARDNQLQADLTALRAQQQEVDADIERQRTLLSQQYQSAIREAQAENDYAKAQALYEEARRKQDALVAQQQVQNEYALQAAKLMAEAGDYTRLAAIYGLSPVELAALMGDTGDENEDDEGEGDEDDLPNLNPYHIPEIEPSNGSGLTGSEFRALIQGLNDRNQHSTAHVSDSGQVHGGSSGSFGGSKSSAGANLIVDQSSINNLGLGHLTEEGLMQLVKNGTIIQYIEDGMLKFRRSDRNPNLPPQFYSTALMPNG